MEIIKYAKKHGLKAAVALFGFAAVQSAFAAVDITAITGAQTDLLAYVAAILALSVAVWAALRAVGLFGKR